MGDTVAIENVVRVSRTSKESAKRAFNWLRARGAPLVYVARQRGWRLTAPFALPGIDPTAEDLQAALTAAGLLLELGQEGPALRARALFEELARGLAGDKHQLRADALRVTQSSDGVRNPRWTLDLLRAAGQGVVRISYLSPWDNARREHEFEPWQVWLHDGVLYVRGYSRTRSSIRTFRLAHIEALSLVTGVAPREPVPADRWQDDDPRYGIDHDRPDTATIRFRGAIARWVAVTRWHPKQEDHWLERGELFQRAVPYRSCRELARRLVALADGLDSVEPAALRAEVVLLGAACAGLVESRKKRAK